MDRQLWFCSEGLLRAAVPANRLGAHALALCLGALTIPVSVAGAAPMMPAPAKMFVHSVGINMPAEWTDNATFARMVARVRDAHIHQVRTGAPKPRFPNHTQPFAVYRRNIEALRGADITSCLVMDPRDGYSPDKAVQLFKTLGPDRLILEGPNEPSDNPGWKFVYPFRYDPAPKQVGHGSARGVFQYTRDLYEAFKAEPLLRNVPIYAPSLIYDYDGFSGNGAGDFSAFVDYGNLHPYTQGVPGSTLRLNVDRLQKWNVPGKPVVATEFGWHTALKRVQNDHWQLPRPEDVQAKYFARALLFHFAHGITRSYMFVLAEKPEPSDKETSEGRFGILHADLSPKPAYTAIKNLLGLLDDAQTGAVKPLDFALDGDTKDIETLLLQRSNGRYVLAIYNNASSYDVDARRDTTPALRLLSLRVQGRLTFARLATPLTSDRWMNAQVNDNILALQVPDHPLLVEFDVRP